MVAEGGGNALMEAREGVPSTECGMRTWRSRSSNLLSINTLISVLRVRESTITETSAACSLTGVASGLGETNPDGLEIGTLKVVLFAKSSTLTIVLRLLLALEGLEDLFSACLLGGLLPFLSLSAKNQTQKIIYEIWGKFTQKLK